MPGRQYEVVAYDRETRQITLCSKDTHELTTVTCMDDTLINALTALERTPHGPVGNDGI